MKTKKRIISVKELISTLLVHWKMILVLGLLFAIVLGTYKIYNSNSTDTKNSDLNFTDYQRNQVNQAIALQERVDYYERYCAESLLMKLDPLKIKTLEINLSVLSDEQNYDVDSYSPFIGIYDTYFNSVSFAKDIIEAGKYDIKQNYLSELINVKVEYKTISIALQFYLPDTIDENNFAQTVVKVIEEKEKNSKEFGAHQVIITTNEVVYRTEQTIEYKIYDTKHNFYNYRSELNDLMNILSSEQKAYLENLTVDNKDSSSNINFKDCIKYAIVGLILGVFVGMCIYVLAYILSPKLKDSRDIDTMYDIKVFGIVDNRKKQKNPIDRIAYNMSHNRKNAELKEQLSIISDTVAAQTYGDSLAISFDYDDKSDEVINMLIASLKSMNKNVVICNNVVNNYDSLKKAKEAKDILFVEKIGKSYYNNIEQKINLLEENNVKIIGSVVIV